MKIELRSCYHSRRVRTMLSHMWATRRRGRMVPKSYPQIGQLVNSMQVECTHDAIELDDVESPTDFESTDDEGFELVESTVVIDGGVVSDTEGRLVIKKSRCYYNYDYCYRFIE